ncbi:hypothetical protein [Kitasatospora cineracea]|uniref:hypothetical protein n=1 Tax=Kitasatospora cineracea TaxID=88074 RepID=UPI0033C5BA27
MDTRRHAVPIPSGPVGIVGRPGPRSTRSAHRVEERAPQPAAPSRQPSASAGTAAPADVELYAVLGED